MAGPTTADRGVSKPSAGASGPPPGRRFAGLARLRGRFSPRTLLLLVVALALGGGIVWALYGSSWLRAERVEVSGVGVLTPEQVSGAARVPLGSPLVSVDTDAVEDRLKKRLPRIDSVEVSRSWPDGVVLDVTERKPVLLLEEGAKFVEVDAKGVRFATSTTPPKGVPRLALDVADAPSLGRFGPDRLVAGAVRVKGDLPKAVAADTLKVAVRSYDYITLELTGGRTVVWGSPEGGELKARALTALMKAAPKSRDFDVSAPTAPAVAGS
ncbi:FtsQ-type POTRA domain-containing protein [Streptomyces sp. NPDC048057]|uniref:cell division protein FtsQ/DivIB n=1 Tax=Streptomyces sp. NPDC048057 TaxID=3155628 RepID=UPI0033EC9613